MKRNQIESLKFSFSQICLTMIKTFSHFPKKNEVLFLFDSSPFVYFHSSLTILLIFHQSRIKQINSAFADSRKRFVNKISL